MAFIIRVAISFVGGGIYYTFSIETGSYGEWIFLVVVTLLTEVVPYIPTLDSRFIEILLMDFNDNSIIPDSEIP